jgi:leucyl aminopeptidase
MEWTLMPLAGAALQVDWVHLDIAGPCWDDKSGGATGFGVGTLAEWAIAQGRA